MTNPTFLTEQAVVWEQIRGTVKTSGAMLEPVAPIASEAARAFGLQQSAASDDVQASTALREFCAKWRLGRLAGPLLPMPLAQQTPAMLPVLAAHQAQASGFGLIALPDTMPIPSEKELRGIVEGAIGTATDYLAEWKQLISPNNPGKNALPQFARVFELQHFYRALMSRHSDRFNRMRNKLKARFADYFALDPSTIGRDLDLIELRLRDEWWKRYPLPSLT